MTPLAPVTISAHARRRGLLSFAFGTRFLVLFAAGLAWLIPGHVLAMLVWDAVLCAAFVIDLFRLPAPAQIAASRSWEGPLSIGTAAAVRVDIDSPVPVLLAMTDEVPSTLRATPPEFAEGGYDVLPRERGDIAIGKLYIRYRSEWGLAQRLAVAEIGQTVRVYPSLEQARALSLYRIRSRQVEARKRQRRQRGQGRDFESLREYRHGDELRDISWLATARRHQLMTRSYQAERSQTVWIVVDAGRLLRAKVKGVSKLDYAVDAALSLAQVVSQSGDKAGLLIYAKDVRRVIAPGRGPHHLRVALEALSQVAEESAEANHARAVHALLQQQTRRALIVWMTDFAETATTPDVIEYALRMRRRHLVVFAAMGQPDLTELVASIPQSETEMFRHAAGLEVTERRERLLGTLRGQGVLTLDVAAPALAASLVNQYLEVKDRGTL